MRNKAVGYIIRVLLQRLIGIALFCVAAKWVYTPRAIVYFSMNLLFAVVSMLVMYVNNSETLAARGKVATNSPLWDKVLLGFYWLLTFFGIYFVAGLESGGAPATLGFTFFFGIALLVFSSLLSLWAVIENTFLESTARIQTDRGQTVCSSGPYRLVRHPTYSAVVLWCASVAMVFQTPLTGAVAGFILVIIVSRTALEDQMLLRSLDGYRAYADKVRYRLVPYLW